MSTFEDQAAKFYAGTMTPPPRDGISCADR